MSCACKSCTSLTSQYAKQAYGLRYSLSWCSNQLLHHPQGPNNIVRWLLYPLDMQWWLICIDNSRLFVLAAALLPPCPVVDGSMTQHTMSVLYYKLDWTTLSWLQSFIIDIGNSRISKGLCTDTDASVIVISWMNTLLWAASRSASALAEFDLFTLSRCCSRCSYALPTAASKSSLLKNNGVYLVFSVLTVRPSAWNTGTPVKATSFTSASLYSCKKIWLS